jgi:iron(III) transport system ATP-binding protein
MLYLENISKSFEGKKVLNHLDLDIKEGEIVSILGKSGSGKSTLLNIIAGFETPDSGLISCMNRTFYDTQHFVEPENRNVGFIFQNYALFPHLTVAKNICFGIDSLSSGEQSVILNQMLELFDIKGHEDKYPHQLSGGQQQRVAIARALARGSKLILFDESFSSIDATLKLKLIIQIKKILKEHKKTAIFVTHDPKEAILLSDKIAFLEEGKMIQYGTPKELNENPASQSVSNLFGDNSYIFKDVRSYL